MAQTGALKTTPLNAVHRRMGAKMVDFGGWDMPVQYSGVLDEHRAVRQGVGLFDVSHMGEIEVRGPNALQLVQHVATNDASRLVNGQAHYSALLYEHGGFVDDILVHKVADDHYFLCVNASNQDKDFAHIASHNRFGAVLENAGERYAQLALQGPGAVALLERVLDLKRALPGGRGSQTPPVGSLRYYHFLDGEVLDVPARVARTGYTGEDGFEVYFAPEHAERLWNAFIDAGATPCGLGARNTLRLEAAMSLYGHEIDASTTPWEAGLDWIVRLDKGDFVGRDALIKQRERGVSRKLMGFEMIGRGIGRDGYQVSIDGVAAGWVTSGGPSPTLGKNIGLCYLPSDTGLASDAGLGRSIQVLVRGQAVEAATVKTPFYRRAK